MRGMIKVWVMVFLLAFVSGCIVVEDCPSPLTGNVTATTDMYDLTQVDIFSLLKAGDITSSQISIKGVVLGSRFSEVQDAFDLPYSMEEYDEGHIINARYISANNKTTLIFHLVDDVVERIVVKSAFNENLHGETIINRKKDDITRFFGKPDFFEDAVKVRTYYYNDIGLEIYHRRRVMLGFGLIPPGSAVPPELVG